MQTALQVHENLCMVLIPLCKNNLNLPICSFFFCPVLGCLLSFIVLSCLLPRFTTLIFCLFVCFYRNQFFSPVVNQISLNPSKGWNLTLQTEKISLNRSTGFMYKLYQQDFRIIPTYVFIENYLNVINID